MIRCILYQVDWGVIQQISDFIESNSNSCDSLAHAKSVRLQKSKDEINQIILLVSHNRSSLCEFHTAVILSFIYRILMQRSLIIICCYSQTSIYCASWGSQNRSVNRGA